MNEPADTHDRRQRLWHRLVGAAVLAALAVILVPILIDFREDDGTAITRSNIPERPAGFRVEEISLMPPLAPQSAPESVSAVVSGVESGSGAPPESRPESPPAPAAPAGGAAPPAPASPASGPPLHGFAVQVGSFSSRENATAMRDRLRGHGFSAFIDQASVDGRAVYRVLVGPDARREHSERLRDRLAGEQNLRGVVVAYE